MESRYREGVQVLQIVWGALMASVVIYGALAFVVAARPDAERRLLAALAGDPLVIALHGVGITTIAAGFFIPVLVLRSGGRRNPLAPPSGAFELWPELQKAVIIRFALFEAPALFGLVCAFLTAQPLAFVPLGAASLIALALSFPSEGRLRQLGDEAHGSL